MNMMLPHRKLLIPILMLWLCLGVHAQQQPPAARKTEEPASGSITGKVVNENGQPLAGAVITIRSVNNKIPGGSTSTGADGGFRITGLEPSLYIIQANAPAYTSADLQLPTNYYRVGDDLRLELVRGGAITGTVTTAYGDPLVGVRVRATMIHDAKDRSPKMPSFSFLERPTDDRGIYRIFGLNPGTYLVSAGGSGFSGVFNPFASDVPTYSPSATRDNAAEITVRTGEDITADIRYRGEPGFSISGTVKAIGTSGAQITLTPADRSFPTESSIQFPGSRGFVFTGLGDGEYDLTALEVNSAPTALTPLLAISETKRISIRGSSISGIEVVTRPLSTINGRVTLEPSKSPECEGKRPPLLAETLVQIRQSEKDSAQTNSVFQRMFLSSGTPNADGSFSLVNLHPGKYQFDPRFYARYWYLQSITIGAPPPTTAARSQTAPTIKDAAANWTVLKTGEAVNNLTITLAEGAASISGRLVSSEGQELPAGIAVYLVPLEPDKAEDVLRFFVTEVAVDGTFTLSKLPPGRYKMVAQVADSETSTLGKLREPETANARAKLRKATETQKSEILLRPCQNVTDYQLKP